MASNLVLYLKRQMLNHVDLGRTEEERKKAVRSLIRAGEIRLGGYRKGRIYGSLSCSSGKRMKSENRVFFRSEEDAIREGYRPCGTCLPEKYKIWKAGR